MATVMQEKVYMLEFPTEYREDLAKIIDDKIHIRFEHEFIPVRACYRYVTQKPWSFFPPQLLDT